MVLGNGLWPPTHPIHNNDKCLSQRKSENYKIQLKHQNVETYEKRRMSLTERYIEEKIPLGDSAKYTNFRTNSQ